MMSLSKHIFPPLTSLPICVPRYYGGVILVGVGTVGLNMYFISRVMKARKEHNVEYPLLYHPTNTLFNCVQRGHQNFLETLPLFLMTLFVGGLRYPRVCAASGLLVLIGRFLYFRGYATGDPSKRKSGAIGVVGMLPLIFGTLAFGAQHLAASIKCSACKLRS